MRRFVGVAAVFMAATAWAQAAQAQDSPRIVMRRPLNPSTAAPTTPSAQCGTPGQPACPTDCDFTGAVWVVGEWKGSACGQGGTATRSVQCMAVRANGARVPKDDAFCLQDADAFHATCSQSGGPSLPGGPLVLTPQL